mmetsp:Transcript_25893/g.59776  ORF Transcript_25893/g.59776 Transcript_25893/m.59776 type:complete len:560 (+) Transcript_25893:67-1746(+)
MAEWEVVSMNTEGQVESAAEWLTAQGLGKHADKILEVSDAETLNDLKLIDASMAEQIIKEADLKVVAAKKFMMALAVLRGEAMPESAQPEGEGAAQAATVLPQAPTTPLQERIVVCLDRSGSMGTPFKEVTLNVVKGETKSSVEQRSRMEAVKVMFYAFRDRIQSFGVGTHELGLLQFDQVVEPMLQLTAELDKFESIVDDVQKRGQTAIYSSIIEATKMLSRNSADNIDLRVLVLTDGQNNSGAGAKEALAAANAIGATVDAIIVGDRPDSDLRRIVTATEGQCFGISSLGEGFELLEAEAMASLKARRGGEERKVCRRENVMLDLDSIEMKSITTTTALPEAAQKRKKAMESKTKVASLSTLKLEEDDAAGLASSSGQQSLSGNAPSHKRILKELGQIAKGKSEDPDFFVGLHIFPAEDNLASWRVLMEGPEQSPFAGGVFLLTVQLPDNYPMSPPNIEFQTPIYHCNVNDAGRICVDVLQDKWTPALTVHKCLMVIRALLAEPCPDDAMRQWIAELTIAHRQSAGTDTRYYDKVKESVQQHASRSVDEWMQLWGVA